MSDGGTEGRLAGKVALVTGGARGQGAVEGELFAAQGATVILADVLDDEGRTVADSIDGATYRSLDVRSEEEWETVVSDVMAEHGRLDVLVNNAGVDMAQKMVDTSLDDFERLYSINQRGVFLGMRTVARALIGAEQPGSIINISSVAGLEGAMNRVAYSSTKWAVTGMTSAAAKELGRYRIRVNSVHPGLIETPMTADQRPIADPELRARMERRIPLGRVGQSIDVANLVLFLASDESDYCTGQAFTVDGGIHA
ncbi:MAG: glucose 1-dehydrogenase [Actinomycetota bacterium]